MIATIEPAGRDQPTWPELPRMRTSTTLITCALLTFLDVPTALSGEELLDTLTVSPLPVDRVFPLTGSACSCAVFRSGPALADTTVLASTTSEAARIRIGNQDKELRHVTREQNGKVYVNTFSSGALQISLRSREVPFEQGCAEYADPPPHGSCYTGTLDVRAGNKKMSAPVVVLCGC